MSLVIHQFSETIQTAYVRLVQITEAESEQFPAPGKWSKKQILGHLIDSAANNHQRFVRVQLTNGLSLLGYTQNDWVAVQQYQSASWGDLLTLWKSYNQHLLHVMKNIPTEKLPHTFRIDESEEVTLGYWMEDYVQHLQHHLQQILS
ncbi:MAG: DinB family protein [Blastocatellia bacterium]|nr:DinB family protein [Blastocatellia bacterium]